MKTLALRMPLMAVAFTILNDEFLKGLFFGHIQCNSTMNRLPMVMVLFDISIVSSFLDLY